MKESEQARKKRTKTHCCAENKQVNRRKRNWVVFISLGLWEAHSWVGKGSPERPMGYGSEEVIVWRSLSQKTEVKSSGCQCTQEGVRREPNCQTKRWKVSRQSLGNLDHSFKTKAPTWSTPEVVPCSDSAGSPSCYQPGALGRLFNQPLRSCLCVHSGHEGMSCSTRTL